MPLLKPTRGTLLNRTHPLARGLVGAWLLNEGGGNKIYNLSGNQSTGAFYGDTKWAAGNFGSCLSFDGTGDYVDCGLATILNFTTSYFTVSAWINTLNLAAQQMIFNRGTWQSAGYYLQLTGSKIEVTTNQSGAGQYTQSIANLFSSNTWVHIVVILKGSSAKIYLNGIEVSYSIQGAHINPASYSGNAKIAAYSNNTLTFNGKISNVMIFNRALTASETSRLYREPYCMFQPAKFAGLFALAPPIWIAGSAAAQSATSASLRQLCHFSGSVIALSQCSALCKIIRKTTASAASAAYLYGILMVSGHLPWFASSLETDRPWLREVLFNCVSANTFKFGVALSGGWFWIRLTGCTALYRGDDMREVDFANVLAVAEQDACEIQPPGYLPHNSNSTYFYIVRRFNNCGYTEFSLSAATKVSIAADGEPASPEPNNIFCSKTKQTAGSKIHLVWFYCPLEQKSKPVRFKIYWDNRTGQVNYDNPLATINYQGRKYYNYQTDAVETGRNLFAIRAEDGDGVENNSTAKLRIDVHAASPDPITILSAETV